MAKHLLTDKEIQDIEENIIPQVIQGVVAGANILDITIDIMAAKGLHEKVAKHLKTTMEALIKQGFSREEALSLLVPTRMFGAVK